ncbi:hypothetical protein LNP25_27640 [Klebsiella variicola subsp. variicola]|nr:hypothetical protein [Klebsiella variicola subsp. variicola]
MIIVGAGLNHWFHLDAELPRPDQYAGLLRLRRSERRRLGALCGPGKTASAAGWQPLAFALDWQRPARHMNSTSYSITTPVSGAMKP